MNILQGSNDPALSDEAVEQLTELVTIAASNTGKADVTNAQVCERYMAFNVLPQHICSPNGKDAISCFTKDVNTHYPYFYNFWDPSTSQSNQKLDTLALSARNHILS